MSTVIVSAAVGLVSSLVTLLVTHWLNTRSDRARAEREARVAREAAERQAKAAEREFHDHTVVRYVEARAKEPAVALALAQNQAIAVLRVIEPGLGNTSALHTVFMPNGVRFTVGRNGDNDVVLSGVTISRVHCAIRCTLADCWLEVFSVNGVTIEDEWKGEGTHVVSGGATIRVGEHALVFRRLAAGSARQTRTVTA